MEKVEIWVTFAVSVFETLNALERIMEEMTGAAKTSNHIDATGQLCVHFEKNSD